MEDVLDVYHRPRDPECPVVCLDETSKKLIAEICVPIAAKPGRPARIDYQYERNGTANIFMLFAPLEGWRQVAGTPSCFSSASCCLNFSMASSRRISCPSGAPQSLYYSTFDADIGQEYLL